MCLHKGYRRVFASQRIASCDSEWKVAQVCPTLHNPMDCTVRGILQARILEWVALPFSRRILPTQGSNPRLLNCRWILYQLSHQFRPVQLLGHVQLFTTPWTAARQASLTIPIPGACLNSCPSSHDAIQSSHPLLSPYPPALNLSQHQGLFK